MQAVARSTGVETRHAVLRELGVMGTGVFLNCAPFLRVRPFGSEMANMETQVRTFERTSACVNAYTNEHNHAHPT